MQVNNPINIGFNHGQHSFLESFEDINKILVEIDLNDWKNIETCLNNENIDACIVELRHVPYSNKNKTKIAALIYQNTIQYQLGIKKEKVSMGNDLRLADGASMAVSSLYMKAQVGYLNDKIKCVVGSNDSFSAYDSFIVETDLLHLFPHEKYDFFPIHATEIWPETGKGIYALVVFQEKIEVFKTLRQLHKFDISDISQPCRQLKMMAQEKGLDNIEAYCSKDAQGNYHFYAIRYDDKIIRHRISESTNALLAEKMLNVLIS